MKPDSDPQVDVKIFDRAAVVQMLDHKKSNVTVKTFYDYADYVIIPYIVRHLEPVDHVDIDTYKDDSLKSFARQCRDRMSLYVYLVTVRFQ